MSMFSAASGNHWVALWLAWGYSKSTSNTYPYNPSVSIVSQLNVSGLSMTTNSLTGTFCDSAAPYKLFASTYIRDTSSSVGISCFVMVYELWASTRWALQNEMPPLILFSNSLYISGVGHSAIGFLINFNADDNAN